MKKLLMKALHLWLGEEHKKDRAAAEWLRQFPHVPRKQQVPFPRDADVGYAGHYYGGCFVMQSKEAFVEEFVSDPEKAWYWRKDKRDNRADKVEYSGLLETNSAISTGLARVLADLVCAGELTYVRDVARLAGEAAMQLLQNRTGYLPGYLVLHPDWEGTLSTHVGVWPVDPERHVLVGRSANGKKGRKGLKTLGDCFISLLRHDRAIGLPDDLMYRPKKNLADRDPDDWALGEEMDRIVREEVGKLPNGPELLGRADEYQREAAKDWLRRYQESKAGVDKQHAQLKAATQRIKELEFALEQAEEVKKQTKSVLQLILELPVVEKLLRSVENIWNEIEKLAGLVGLGLESLKKVEPLGEETAPAVVAPAVVAPAVVAPAVVAPAVVAPAVVAPAVVAPEVVAPEVAAPEVVAPAGPPAADSKGAKSDKSEGSKNRQFGKGGPTIEM